MNLKSKIGVYSLILIVVLIAFISSCKKNGKNENNSATEIVTDIDSNVYHTMTVGNQIWMVENLKTTRYNDGTAIPNVTSDSVWEFLVTPACCWYNNDEKTYKNPYGALYNWYAVNKSKLAPKGWHVPSDAEWQVLVDYLGGVLVAGGKMKEADTIHWYSPNTGADNSSGFTGLPGGFRVEGSVGLHVFSFMWSTSEYDSISCFDRTLDHTTTMVTRNIVPKTFGLSIRCVKD